MSRSNSPVGRCRSCGAKVIWCTTTNGKQMPVDFAPARKGEGNIAIRPSGPIWEAIYAKHDQPVEGCSDIRRVSHFVTCPNRDQHRKKD